MMTGTYHIPVLVDAVDQYLIGKENGFYVDGTLGGGGHAEQILKRHPEIKQYLGLDQDRDALTFSAQRLKSFGNVRFEYSNFSEFRKILAQLGIHGIDGLLLDLGVSSYQIDTADRGFSFMKNGSLDMRMDQEQSMTAATLLNNYEEKALADLIYLYGEERRSRAIARRIVNTRIKKPFETTSDLRDAVSAIVKGPQQVKSLARVFQALRIAVNGELDRLRQTLMDIPEILNPGGRIVVIAYHSLEDRIVKQFFRKQANPCECPPELPQCICGKEPRLKILTRRAVKAGEEEIKRNSRSRSARLRAGEKL